MRGKKKSSRRRVVIITIIILMKMIIITIIIIIIMIIITIRRRRRRRRRRRSKSLFVWERGRKARQTKDKQEDCNMKIAVHCNYFDFLTMIFIERSTLDKNLFVKSTLC